MDLIQVEDITDDGLCKSTLNTDVFLIGYEGRSIKEFVDELFERGITQLVDVRERAFSWKSGFSKKPLRDILEANGIRYEHIPKLGSPRAARDVLKSGGSFDEFASEYGKHLSNHQEAILHLKRLIMEQPTAIMCFERDHHICHRSIIANTLKMDGFRILYL